MSETKTTTKPAAKPKKTIYECKEVSTLTENDVRYLVYTDDEAFATDFAALPKYPFPDNPGAGLTHVVTEVKEAGKEYTENAYCKERIHKAIEQMRVDSGKK